MCIRDRYCDKHVCQSVCLFARITRETTHGRTSPHSHACCLWPCMAQYSSSGVATVLCTSGFVDDVMCLRDGCIWRVTISDDRIRQTQQLYHSKPNFAKTSRHSSRLLSTGGEVCCLRLSCCVWSQDASTATMWSSAVR